MTVSYVDSGSFDYSAGAGDTSFTVPYPNPGFIPAGDLLVLIVGGHLQTSFQSGATCNVDGWTLITSIDGCGGYATNTSDAGPTSTWAFYKIAAGTEFSPITVNVTRLAVGWGKITQITNDTGLWDVAGTTADEQDGGDVDITFSSDPGVKAGDFVVAAFTIPTDLNTPAQFSGSAFSQTGVTYDNASLRSAEADSVVGADLGGLIVNTSVTAGTSSAAPTLTATAAGTTTNVRGAAIFVRVREAAEASTPSTAIFSFGIGPMGKPSVHPHPLFSRHKQ